MLSGGVQQRGGAGQEHQAGVVTGAGCRLTPLGWRGQLLCQQDCRRHGGLAVAISGRAQERAGSLIVSAVCASERLHRRPVGRLLVGHNRGRRSFQRLAGPVLPPWRHDHLR